MESYLYIVVGSVRSNVIKYSMNNTEIILTSNANDNITKQFEAEQNFWYVGENNEQITKPSKSPSPKPGTYEDKMFLKLKTAGTKTFGLSEDRKRISSSVSTKGNELVWLVVKNALCGDKANLRININDGDFIVNHTVFTVNRTTVTAENCNQQHIIKFMLPANVLCNKLKTLQDIESLTKTSNVCVFKLHVEKFDQTTSQADSASNFVSIIQQVPKITNVNLIKPSNVENIDSLYHDNKPGVIPTDGSGVIRIYGTNFGNRLNKILVYYNNHVCTDLKLIKSHEILECNVIKGQGIAKVLKVFVGFVGSYN
jgi:hypothetical protein